MKADLIIAPIRELHTLQGRSGPRRGRDHGDTGVIRDAGIVVNDGHVASVGPAHEILREHSSELVVDASKSVVTPGLVDCHTHLVWAGDRGEDFVRRSSGISYEQIAAEGGGILSTMRATREASVEDLTDSLLSRIELIRSLGTTTCEIKASYGLSPEGCRNELDAIAAAKSKTNLRIAVTFMAAHAYPPDRPREDFVELIRSELLPMAVRHPAGPTFNDVFCEVGAFDVETTELILRAGIELGLTPKVHADEFNVLGGVELGCRLGAASCDHLLASGAHQFRTLAESSTVAVVMPGTAHYLGKPYADARAMIDTGCAVALGTDFNPGSSMIPSMPFVLGLAVSKMKLTPEEALVAATVNAAAALPDAIPEGVGTLAPGAPADLCLWPARTLGEMVWQYTFIRPTQVFIGGRAA